jgi:hypothetical protein
MARPKKNPQQKLYDNLRSLGMEEQAAREFLAKSLNVGVEELQVVESGIQETRMRGRRPKAAAGPTTYERQDALQKRILGLRDELETDGYGSLLRIPGPVEPIAKEINDPKTGGFIAHVEEPLGAYIQRVSITGNFAQRQPFDHMHKDKIYRRLIRDFIKKAAMPEAKIAALSDGSNGGRAASLNEAGLRYSVIDGLQRLYCYCIAILLVFRRESLVTDRCITAEAWEYVKEAVEATGDVKEATERILGGIVRYEIFWQIDLEGLLHYMVTYNTGQRRMSLEVQLEIMENPLIKELEVGVKIPIYEDRRSLAGQQKPREQFAASDLVMATRAFIESNPQIKKPDEAESLLEREDGYLESSFDVGDINDVVYTLKRISVDIHQKIMDRYADNPSNKYILSGGGTFLLSFAAACGKVRNNLNMPALKLALERLTAQLEKPADDPLNLEVYQRVLRNITTSRGKATRRLVYETFLRFFNGTTTALDWADTAVQIGI